MKRIASYNITHKFLLEIDNFLKENIHSLTCRDIHDIYRGLFDKLKEYRGTSSGFTGFSEFLVFRFLIHTIGGGFKSTKVTQDTKCFIRGNLRITQSLLPQSGVNIRPDILIEDNQKSTAAMEIKIYLPNGMKTANEVLKRFKKLYNTNRDDFRALLLIFFCPKPERLVKQSVVDQLQALEKRNSPWFHVKVLGNSHEQFEKVLIDSLELGHILCK